MKVDINEQGQLVVDMQKLVEAMSDEARKQFYQHLAFQDTLMIAVVDTVANGVCFEGDWWSTRIESKIREKLLPLVGNNAMELFRKQSERIDTLESQLRLMRDRFQELLNHWPKEFAIPNRCDADFASSTPCTCAWKREDVIAFLVGHGIEVVETVAR